MEFKVDEDMGFSENDIVCLIYDRIDAYWGKFPNLWNKVTKDDIASDVAIDLYKPRKADGVPHIKHYYETRGERSLKPLIGVVTYACMQHAARFIYCTGIYDNEARRNVYNPLSLDMPIGIDRDCEDSKITLMDLYINEDVNITKEVDYVMLVDSLPNKIIDGIYYKVNGKYVIMSYKTLLKEILDGYTQGQIGEKLFKINKQGELVNFKDVSKLVKDMKNDIKEFLENNYSYTVENYRRGESL